MPELPTLVIDRSRWDCGNRFDELRDSSVQLVNEQGGLMCCLGFLTVQVLDVPHKECVGCTLPLLGNNGDYADLMPFKPNNALVTFFQDCATINDCEVGEAPSFCERHAGLVIDSEATREAWIAEVMRECGLAEVEFTGELPASWRAE